LRSDIQGLENEEVSLFMQKSIKGRGLKEEMLRMGIIDGLPGLMDAFNEAFPKANIQRCIVHKLRNVAVKSIWISEKIAWITAKWFSTREA
jgi:transposase-like protein